METPSQKEINSTLRVNMHVKNGAREKRVDKFHIGEALQRTSASATASGPTEKALLAEIEAAIVYGQKFSSRTRVVREFWTDYGKEKREKFVGLIHLNRNKTQRFYVKRAGDGGFLF